MLITNLILIILFYFLGSIPFGYLLTKIFGFGDIRNIGSGNVGATNVLRTGNRYLAFAVLCLDISKGLIPFVILNSLYDTNTLHSISLCHFAIIGHIFPVWLKFKGGKGVATYFGVLIALSYEFFFIFGISWLVISFLFRYASLSSIVSSLTVFIYSYFFNNNFSLILFIFFIIILYTHRGNIVRLKNSEESKIKL